MITRFITATGTGVGKTFVTAALTHQLRAKGASVRVLKPVVTGCGPVLTVESDTATLLRSNGVAVTEQTIAQTSPFRFARPLAPSMAARKEGRALNLSEIVDFCRAAERGSEDVLLIEGVGGVMVPLNDQETVLDWIAMLGCPVLLVAGSYLGTLSHALTALAVLAARHVPVGGLIVAQSEDGCVGLEDTRAELGRFLASTPVVAVRRIVAEDAWMYAPDLTFLVN